MSSTNHFPKVVAIIGAGPAGLFAARELAQNGVHVVIFNRDVKPGGLAEYGIFPTKYKMKAGLRNQFRDILALDQVDYYGYLPIGTEAEISLEDLRQMGFHAVLVTVGAQGTKWLGLPGEDLCGVYHAKDLVYHYNLLPPYSDQSFPLGQRTAVIGVGNVMMDIAHWAIRHLKIEEVIAVARRGPSEVKFTKAEMQLIAKNLDLTALEAEMARCASIMAPVGQDVAAAKAFILAALPKADEPISKTQFRFQFFSAPKRILGNEQGLVTGLEVEDTTLVAVDGGEPKAKGLGTFRTLPVDSVVFAIGDKVDASLGLPVEWNEYVKNPEPRFPIEEASYEAFTPNQGPIEGVFMAGWARKASDGLVGVARKDGTNGSKAVLAYLAQQAEGKTTAEVLAALDARLSQLERPFMRKSQWQKLDQIEQDKASANGLPEFKFALDEEMFAAVNG